ncbi:MAG: DUF370 domain-containing protein [Synergistes sp.]|nr:DUF370 domain-containing protein [Synergistes sp.]
MSYKLLHAGFGNMVVADRVVSIITPDSAPVKRLKDEARDAGLLVDITQGRKTRSIIILDSRHVVLSAIQPETLTARFEGKE